MLFYVNDRCFLDLVCKLRASVAGKVPQVYPIFLTDRDNSAVVIWTEHYTTYWISVTDKCLEEVRKCLLSFVVPDFEH